jgi:hypothetical protein
MFFFLFLLASRLKLIAEICIISNSIILLILIKFLLLIIIPIDLIIIVFFLVSIYISCFLSKVFLG